MSDEMTIKLDGDDYVVQPEGGGLRVGRRVGGDVTWLESVDGSLLDDQARTALSNGDTSDESLLRAVRGVVQAEVERGA
ncbi:hypothetical protein E9549_15220 [Blastococcus sp. MG754426]|uniref:hypothetical protein n=1 Tax=unclassified Blastococcus TaxID=2619396 RepID=UPI001EF1034C|nr:MULTISPECIES: hypothetical protein [unclassified Blastococcus]MCF6508746.1 hypothetical protein [Blastococcus sp. MG754426]MCF6513358.1 hypothetical protein [Blastococcus sp. MG754427]MCF6734576.1 hypothetical protein [Blastococcus sp. KM273129]